MLIEKMLMMTLVVQTHIVVERWQHHARVMLVMVADQRRLKMLLLLRSIVTFQQ